MKILELRLKNLNSLYGEWLIDFSHPEYVSNGIFALTGPTGAGKSTILDAICLALYGATPRLGKITKSSNEIMSRQTGECYAEVIFESQAGRFICHWSQHRARKKAEGRLADARHEISDVKIGKPIETKKSRVPRVIEEKTGMDFERFTRSMLLAQGGFDTFLKADAEQKSKILEQITGTEIYSQISRQTHERQREEQEKLNLLQATTSGIVILAPEQEKAVEQELKIKQEAHIDLDGKSVVASKAITWLTMIDELKKEVRNLSEEAAKFQSDMVAFKPERDKLERAIKAALLDGSYATLKAIRQQQSDDQAALKVAEEGLPALETCVKEQFTALKLAEQQTIKAKDELQIATPILKQVRALDQTLVEQQKSVLEGEDICQQDVAKIDADQQLRLKELEKQTEARNDLALAEDYLNEHAQDEWLISGLAGVEEQLSSLLLSQKEIDQKKNELKKTDAVLEQTVKKLDECTKQCGTRKQELEDASQNLQQGKNYLNALLGTRLLREYRTEKETLLREMAYLSKITELEDHRTKLEDGKPCPLCGAEEHPFAQGNIPVADETEKKITALSKLIAKAEDQEAVIKKLAVAEVTAREDLTNSEKLQVTVANDKKAVEKTLVDLKDSLGKIRSHFAALEQAVLTKLQPLGLTEIPVSLLASLKERLNAWQTQIKQKTKIEKKIANLDSELKRLVAVIATQNNALGEKRKRLETLRKEHAASSTERKNLYGAKKPDNEEICLHKTIAATDKTEKKARDQNSKQQQKLNTAQDQAETLKKRIAQQDPKLKKAKADFITALAPAGFTDEKEFLGARLTTEQRNTLSAKAKKLDDSQTDLKARQKDRATSLSKEIAKKITNIPLDKLESQFEEYEEFLKQLRDDIAALKHKLRENVEAKKRIKNKQAAIEAQKKECHRWEKLHALIGSADGKKYRNFAQGLTFELMISHANRQLGKMTDRYLLIRDNKQPLELNVVDSYQAGEIRSTRNLSGGESFIVSLTLALGLSKMASRKVRVDSLFLDEGFGTLDEEALETALETLSGLQQGGKLIGIISHVSALKERISTQITITPASGGRSTLVGPGCIFKAK